MPRLVEIQRPEEAPSTVQLEPADVLSIGASGGRVESGQDAVECLGAFLPAVTAANGDVIAPMGAPSTVLFAARAPGRATLRVMTGDPWSSPVASTVQVVVA